MCLQTDPAVVVALRHELQKYDPDKLHRTETKQWLQVGLLNPLLDTKEKRFLGRITVTLDFSPTGALSTLYCEIDNPRREKPGLKEAYFRRCASWRKTKMLVVHGREVLVRAGSLGQFFMTKRGTLGELVDRLGALYA